MTEEEKPQVPITPEAEASKPKEPEITTWQHELRDKFYNRLEGIRGLEQGEKYINDIKARTENVGAFTAVQEKLQFLTINPDTPGADELRRGLKKSRATLISEASARNVFGRLKDKTERISYKHKEAGFKSWENYKKEIVEIDTDEIEDEMGDNEDIWSSDFSGMNLERKRIYLMYLNQARNRASGIDDEGSRKTDRALENEGWDKPEGLELEAVEYLDKEFERAKEEGKKEEAQKGEFDVSKASFREVNQKMILTEDKELRSRCYTELHKRIQEAEREGYIDREEMKNSIELTLKESTWDETSDKFYYIYLHEEGRRKETAKRGASESYRNDKRYNGAWEILYDAAANTARAQGISRKILGAPNAEIDIDKISQNKDQTDYVIKKSTSLENFEKTGRIRDMKAMSLIGFTPDIDLASFVETSYEASGEDIYEKLRNEKYEDPIIKELLKTMKDLSEANRRSLEIEEEQLEAMQRGYGGFVDIISKRKALNPSHYELYPPVWYEKLSPREQEMITWVLNANYLSSIMAATGERTYTEWVDAGLSEHLPFKKEAIQEAWQNLPGFRVALATITKDFFEENKDHLVISGKGYEILKDRDNLDKYMTELKSAITLYLYDSPQFVQWAKDRNIFKRVGGRIVNEVDMEKVATLAACAAETFIHSTASYLSGDEKRPYVERPEHRNITIKTEDGRKIEKKAPGIDDPLVNGGDDIRAFLLPGLKAWKKWWLERDEQGNLVRPKETSGIAEERWSGTLGAWMKFNILNNIDGFGDRWRRGEMKYIPDRLWVGMLDFQHINVEGGKKSAGSLLVSKEKTQMERRVGNETKNYRVGEVNLYDYKDGVNAINWMDSYYGELHGVYGAKRAEAKKLWENLQSRGGRETSAMDIDSLNNALTRIRKLPCVETIPSLRETYYSPGFIEANLVQTITRGEGPILGIKEIVLNIPNSIYDIEATKAMSESDLFKAMPPWFTREYVLKIFHAKDMNNLRTVMLDTIFGGFSLTDERIRLREKAAKNLAKK